MSARDVPVRACFRCGHAETSHVSFSGPDASGFRGCVESACTCVVFGAPEDQAAEAMEKRIAKKIAERQAEAITGTILGGCVFNDPFYERLAGFIARYVRDNRPDLLERDRKRPAAVSLPGDEQP